MKTKRFLSVLLAISTIIVSMIAFTVCSSANTNGWIAPLSNGVETKTSLYRIGPDHSEVYRVRLTTPGDLKITIKSNLYKLSVSLQTYDNKIIKPVKIESTIGSNVEQGDYTYLKWNSSKKKYEGKITFSLEKGEYFFRLFKADYISSQTSSTVTLKATYPTKTTDADDSITCFAIPMKVGDTLQLAATISPKSDEKVSWKSSKSSVAKVSSKGLVTAKSKGTATITAYIRESKVKIQIKVK